MIYRKANKRNTQPQHQTVPDPLLVRQRLQDKLPKIVRAYHGTNDHHEQGEYYRLIDPKHDVGKR